MAKRSIKAETAAQIIRKRIIHGDHALNGILGERLLAEEFGISRQTLRNGLKMLEKEGLLVRQSNGRLQVAPTALLDNQKCIIGFVKHSRHSHDHDLWSEAVRIALEGENCILRNLTFEHYGDAAIATGLSGFDAMFFLPPAGEIPRWLSSKMRESKCKVIVLDQDVTAAEIPSVVMFPPRSERKLMEHLVQFGHRRIDCLNTQICDSIIEGRIAAWRSFLGENMLEGELHSASELRPVSSAYELIKARLREGKPMGTALVCTTGPAALGAMRAFYDAGLEIGKDISVCAVNDERLGPYLIPSLTCLQSQRVPYLTRAVQWILNGRWKGPLLIQPDDVPMFIGDSTGPAPCTVAKVPLISPVKSLTKATRLPSKASSRG